jgi:hypothetical protein
VPLAPDVMVIQVALSLAVHAQPVAADTVTLLLLAPNATFADAGVIVGAHGAPACVTVKLLPPMVSVAVRAVVVGFAVKLYVTDPFPVPPVLTVSHAALLLVLHAHPVTAVTVTVPVPAVAATLAEVPEIVGAHGAPACVTVKVLPPIVTVPVRDVRAVFAPTSNVTEPFPFPLAPEVTVIHAALLVAVQAQPVAAVTVTAAPVAPVAATLDEAAESVGAHGAAACVTPNVLPPIVSVAVRGVVAGFAVTV